MELLNLKLKVGGDNNNVLVKRRITAAEAKLLFELHGGIDNQPIDSIEIVADEEVDARALKEQFLAKYNAKNEYLQLVEKLFPGAVPTMIEKASDIGLVDAIPIKRASNFRSKPGPKPKPKTEQDPLG